MRYLFIFEDGSLTQEDEISEEIKAAYNDGLYDIVDMEGSMQLGPDGWVDIAKN